MSKHRSMAKQLMQDVWLWCVKRLRRMPDVLSRVEYSKCESIEEFSLRQQSTDWLESPASLCLEESRDVFKLWNLIAVHSDFLLELIN